MTKPLRAVPHAFQEILMPAVADFEDDCKALLEEATQSAPPPTPTETVVAGDPPLSAVKAALAPEGLPSFSVEAPQLFDEQVSYAPAPQRFARPKVTLARIAGAYIAVRLVRAVVTTTKSRRRRKRRAPRRRTKS